MNHLLATGRLDFCLASASAAQVPIRFSVTDLDGMDALQREKGPFTEALKVASGRSSFSSALVVAVEQGSG